MAREQNDRKKDWRNAPDWSEEFAEAAIDRFEAFQKRLKTSKRHARIQRTWRKVYMRDKFGNCDGTEISAGGRKGETLLIQGARLGRLIRDHVTQVQQTKSQPEPMAANSDADCQAQVSLARGIIEHYKRESDLEAIKAWRATVAEICGDSYLHVPWDPDLGKEVAVEDLAEPQAEPVDPVAKVMPGVGVIPNEEQAEPVDNAAEDTAEPGKQRIAYEGDFKFQVGSPYDYAYDRMSPEPKKPRWGIFRAPMNRHDLRAQVLEETTDPKQLETLLDAIDNAERWSEEIRKIDYDNEADEYDDTIAVYYVYCDKARGRPEGRAAIVINKKAVLIDGPLAEPRIPVFRLSQGEVLFRNEATTANHDGLPLTDALDAMLSTILSNAANFGMQRVLNDRRSNIDRTELDAGAALINYDSIDKAQQPVAKPEVMQMDRPDGLIQDWELLAQELDTVVGSTRLDQDKTKGDSGAKVAALYAAAQSIGSSFVAACLRSDEEVFTYLIASLGIHATMPRLISVLGKHNSFEAKTFQKDSLNKIVRVMVAQADAIKDTLPGRLAIVEAINGQTPEQQKQTIAVLSTGRLESITDPEERPRILLERENEALIDPHAPMPTARPNDPNAEHIKSHSDQANDPDIRKDPVLIGRIDMHNAEHLGFLMPGQPVPVPGTPEFVIAMLHITGQNPLPPPAPPALPPSMSAGPEAGPLGPNDVQPPQQGGQPPGPTAAGGNATGGPGGMPARPKMPKNPLDGQPMAVPGAGGPASAPAGNGMAM